MNTATIETEDDGYMPRYDTAQAYANRLATYLTCAKTIREHTLRNFDEAPSLSNIQGAIDCRKAASERQRRAVEVSPHDNGWHFDARYKKDESYKLRAAKPVKAAPRPVITIYKRGSYQPVALPEPATVAAPSVSEGPKALVAAVARAFGLTYSELMSSSRKKLPVCARAVVVKILRDRNPSIYSLTRLAQIIGRTDHSTVVNLLDTFPERARRYPQMLDVYRMMGGVV